MFEGRGSIDVERLREDMENDALGACYGGGFGEAFFDFWDASHASDEEVIEMARKQGIDLDAYRK